MALERRCLTVSLQMPEAHALSVWMGVAGCGCPMSSRIVRSMAASFPLWNNVASSALVAEEKI